MTEHYLPSLNIMQTATSYAGRPTSYGVDPVSVAQRLIQIPSHESEIEIAQWMSGYVGEYCPSGFKTFTIPTGRKDRSSIMITNTRFPQIILAGHMDTVGPWNYPQIGNYDPFAATIDEGYLYGLGAADQKSPIGSALAALAAYKGKEHELPSGGVAFIFTSLEETTIGGMKAVARYFEKLQNKNPNYIPSFLLFTGSNGELCYQCRGVAEFDMTLTGTTGHTAIPQGSIDAHRVGVATLDAVENTLSQLSPTSLGRTTQSVSAGRFGVIEGGRIRRKANKVPDTYQFTYEARLAGQDVNGRPIDAATLAHMIQNEANQRGLTTSKPRIKLDIGPWRGSLELVAPVVALIKRVTGVDEVLLYDAATRGFEEGAILHDVVSRNGTYAVPSAGYGSGDKETQHRPDERISIEGIRTDFEVYRTCLSDEALRTRPE